MTNIDAQFPFLRFSQIILGIKKYNKVIFLDFDGVLATEEYTDSLLEKGQRTKDKYGTLFNPDCVEHLRNIVKKTNAGIVITSSWKNYLSLWNFLKMWKYRKLPGSIVGVTPNISIYRGDEIEKWLNNHRDINNYVIIDDMDYRQFHQNQCSHLVTTNHYSGLNKSSSNQAIGVLT